jgi:hypothetical protein
VTGHFLEAFGSYVQFNTTVLPGAVQIIGWLHDAKPHLMTCDAMNAFLLENEYIRSYIQGPDISPKEYELYYAFAENYKTMHGFGISNEAGMLIGCNFTANYAPPHTLNNANQTVVGNIVERVGDEKFTEKNIEIELNTLIPVSEAPSATPSVSETTTPTPTTSVSATSTATPSPSATPSVSETTTPTPTTSTTPSVSETSTPSPSATPSVSETTTPTPSPSATGNDVKVESYTPEFYNDRWNGPQSEDEDTVISVLKAARFKTQASVEATNPHSKFTTAHSHMNNLYQTMTSREHGFNTKSNSEKTAAILDARAAVITLLVVNSDNNSSFTYKNKTGAMKIAKSLCLKIEQSREKYDRYSIDWDAISTLGKCILKREAVQSHETECSKRSDFVWGLITKDLGNEDNLAQINNDLAQLAIEYYVQTTGECSGFASA